MHAHDENLAKQLAPEVAEALLRAARQDGSGATFRHLASRIVASALEPAGITLVQQGVFWVARGSEEALYQRLTIDFIRPGLIEATGSAGSCLEVVTRVKKHIIEVAGNPGRGFTRLGGIAIDGHFFLFVRLTGDKWFIDRPVPIDEVSTEYFLRHLYALRSGVVLVPENLIRDFGPRAPRARRAIQALHSALRGAASGPVFKPLARWRHLFSAATDHRSWTERMATRPAFKKYVQGLGLDPETTQAPEILFVLHTYYALLIKLVATSAAAYFAGGMRYPLSRLCETSDGEFLGAFVDLERGTLFHAWGLRNFLEGNIFGWYVSVWSPEIAEAVRALAQRLDDYEPATLDLMPETTRDPLRDLYLHLMPRAVRHDLGEYYTPDWLAEHLLVETLGEVDLGDPDKRVLDPACGSGTFLVIVIRNIVQRMRRDHLPAPDTLARILHNVIGFDLNPLAVMAARTNYLLALGSLLRAREGNIDIPIHLVDSVLASSRPSPGAGEEWTQSTVKGGRHPNPWSSEEHHAPECLAESERATTPASTRIEPCHYVVGNPPWVNWESLPDDYRRRTRSLWVHYGLFPHGGMDTILGKGKKDIATLMTYVVVDTYLLKGGKLGFVLPQNLFKTGGAGKGFRRFMLPDGTPFGPIRVEDMVDISPFGRANNRTALAVFEKGRAVRYPVPYTLWRKYPESPVDTTVFDISFRVVMGQRITPRRWYAEPVEKQDATAPWITARGAALRALHNVLGDSPYQAHEGANTGGANGIYWVEVLQESGDLAVVRNITAGTRRKVPRVRASVETDILYPLLRGRDVTRWRVSPSAQLIMAQDPETRRGIGQSIMEERFPRALAYLSRFETVLRSRAAFRRYFRDTAPFWSMFNVSPFTFSPWKVVWREQAKRFTAAVVGPNDGRPVIPDHKLMMVAVESPEEAYYLCAVLNSAPATMAVAAYTIPVQMNTHVLQHVAVPRFSGDDPRHREMARLAEAAQRAASQGTSADVQRLEEDIDHCAAALWRLTDLELLEIKRSLEDG